LLFLPIPFSALPSTQLNSLALSSLSLLNSVILLWMAQLAFSFCLAVPDNAQVRDGGDSSFRDLQNACATLASQNRHITAQFTNESFVKTESSLSKQISACNITLTGPAPLVVTARGELLRDNPTKVLRVGAFFGPFLVRVVDRIDANNPHLSF
jgi:hypothetical protein